MVRRLMAAGLVLAMAAGVRAQDPAPKKEPPAIKLGVVNVLDIYNSYERTKDFVTKLEADKAVKEKALQQQEKALKEKVDQLGLLKEDSKFRQELQLDIVQMEAAYKFSVEKWNEEAKQRLEKGVPKLYNEIREEVDAYAKEAGLTLVLKVDDNRLPDKVDGGMESKINQRQVLYYDPAYDITAEVLKRLNDKYAKVKAVEGGGEKKEDPK